ncbi:MAG: DNA repair exonuclease [Candidatus Nitrosocaldus sp.]
MQILHVSDTHLGCMQFNLKEREDDVYEAFNEAIDAAVKDRVDAVIHAGDVFHTPKPSGTAMLRLGEALKRLNEHGIRFFFTLGEHDISRVRDTPSPYVFHKLGMATYIGDGKPHIHKDMLLIGFHKHKKSESDDLRRKLRSITNTADAKRRILLLHQGLGEFHPYANELSMNDLPLGFNYYAMGHLHDHAMKPYGDGIVCYPGSIDPTPGEGIREFKKGFCIVDLSGSEARVDFIQVRSSRRHMEYVVEYERLGDLIKKVMDDAKGLKKKPLVAVRIKGKGIDSARIASILSRLNDICLHYTWEVEITSRASAGRLYNAKPDIDKELFALAKDVLANEDYANLAINELLPLLSDGDVDGAVEMIWKRFEESRSVMDK